MTQTLAVPATYAADFERLPDTPAWLRDIRRAAFDRFAELGFPTARKGNEKWKYTNVGPIADVPWTLAAPARVSVARLAAAFPWDEGWARAVFLDGRYSPDLSRPGEHVASLADALAADGTLLERHLTRHAPFADDAFIALNTAFLADGALVHVPQGVSAPAPVHLVFAASGAAEAAAYPRSLVVAEPGSSLTLIETYAGLADARYLTNGVTEIVLGEGARVEHYRVLLESEDAFHVGMTRVYQGAGSQYNATAYARGAAIARNDILATLDAPEAKCYMHGLYVTTGSQHIDNNINIDHAQPHTTSRLFYKGILDGRSRAVFGGTVLVRPGAIKTDAHQEDKNLVLSDEAEIASKPALEIYADDVICGHGATAGTVAEDAIFYMRSRGLDTQAATSLLIRGFASQITDTIKLQPLRAFVESSVAGALEGVTFGDA